MHDQGFHQHMHTCTVLEAGGARVGFVVAFQKRRMQNHSTAQDIHHIKPISPITPAVVYMASNINMTPYNEV